MNNELDSAIRIKINQKLVETGEKEVLKDFLRTKLTSIGWKEQLKSHCKECIKNKKSTVSVEDLVAEISPFARASVPESLKLELLEKIKVFIAENIES